MTTTIIGGGLSGLIACQQIADSHIVEANETLPNNHSAVLRFKSSIVGDALDIPFKKVQMMKTIAPWRNPVADNLSYARKCTGIATLRSIHTVQEPIQERWIAPEDLVNQLGKRLEHKITLDQTITCKQDLLDFNQSIISTIPMTALMHLLGFQHQPKFQYVHGFNINCTLDNVDAYATIYVPDPEIEFNRISLTGNKLTIEFSHPNLALELVKQVAEQIDIKNNIIKAMMLLGLDNIHNVLWLEAELSIQKYSKILPIDEDVRRRFIVWASDQFNIYSLGRFAVWRPTLLLDDLINDIRIIKRLMNGKSSYEYRR